MRKFLAIIVLSISMFLTPSVALAYDYDVPAGCSSGSWVLSDSYIGGKWFNPLYPIGSRANNYGAGWRFSPCSPIGSYDNGYGAGFGIH